MDRFRGDDILARLEEGALVRPVQGAVLAAVILYAVISGIVFSSRNVTPVYVNSEAKQYHVRKVSRIPKEKEKEEADKIAVEDDRLTPEEHRERYFQYVISTIESNKYYPITEQKKEHQSSVAVRLFIGRTGQVRKVELLREATYEALTGAAIESIRRSAPFKPFPAGIPDEELVLNAVIQFRLY